MFLGNEAHDYLLPRAQAGRWKSSPAVWHKRLNMVHHTAGAQALLQLAGKPACNKTIKSVLTEC